MADVPTLRACAVGSLALTLTAVLAGCTLPRSAAPDDGAAPTDAASQTETEPAGSQPPTTPPAEPTDGAPTPETVTVEYVVDGDTLQTSAGRVRMVGVDTPEWGECNRDQAVLHLKYQVAATGGTVVLVPVPGHDDFDRYGRLLRYIDAPNGVDLGLGQITGGVADARYDSRDGYDPHPREDAYHAADEAVPNRPC